MSFAFACRVCGHENWADVSQVGQKVACSGCQTLATVAAPQEKGDSAASPPPLIKFACPGCGRKYATKSKMIGRTIACSACGASIPIVGDGAAKTAAPAANGVGSARPPKPKTPPLSASSNDLESDGGSLLDDLAAIEGPRRRKRAESVLPSRSQTMERVRQEVADREAVEAQKAVAQAKRKKKRKTSSGPFDPKETLTLVGFVAAFVIGLTILALVYPGIRFPLGGILVLTGFVVYVLGMISLRQLAAEEGVVVALLFRFCPPYQWWFILSRWGETKEYLAFFVAGSLIIAVGGSVLKTSDLAKQAAAADRAYQKAQQLEDQEE